MNIIINKENTLNTSTEVLTFVSNDMYSKGYVKEGFRESIIEREKTYPTGINSTINFSLCHTELSFVDSNCLYIFAPQHPILFGNMENPEINVEVEIIYVLAFKTAEDHLAALSSLIQLMNDDTYISAVRNIDEDIIKSKLTELLKGE